MTQVDRDNGDENDGLGPQPADCYNCRGGRVDLDHLGWFYCSCPAGVWLGQQANRRGVLRPR